jgi:hypothetical protein
VNPAPAQEEHSTTVGVELGEAILATRTCMTPVHGQGRPAAADSGQGRPAAADSGQGRPGTAAAAAKGATLAERGGATLVGLGLTGLILMVGIVAVDVGALAGARAAAQTAADMAALAALTP